MPCTLHQLRCASQLHSSLGRFALRASALYKRSRSTSTPCLMQSTDASIVQVREEFYKHGLIGLSPGRDVINILSKIANPREAPLGNSMFVKPKSLMYELDGRTRKWDIIESHASVGIIIYHRGLDSFMLVRQWRPAVYASACRAATAAGEPAPRLAVGFTHELCAGIIDKDKPMSHICAEEILEECGYAVPPESISEVTSFLSATGTSGARHVLFYSEVEESQKVSSGGGMAESGECIEVLALPVDNAEAFVMDSSMGKSPGMMFGLLWASVQFKTGRLQRAGANGGNSSGAQQTGAGELGTGDLLLKSVLPT